jgi:8-oxo-dGTP diphosphatase
MEIIQNPASHPPGVTRVGVGVIVVRGGRVLLGERRGSHGAGTWALPGGNLDFGESVEECARRELLEETGITLHSVRQAPYTVDHFPDHGRHYVTLFVEALGAMGEPALLEPEKCCGWSWFDWHDFPKPVFDPLATLRASGFVPQGVASGIA